MNYDAIVIGSGFGGAVAACRLAESGCKVLVLERGRRWSPQNFPREPEDPWVWDHRAPEQKNGWFDIRLFPNMAVAQGAGVGGGSLVYANVSCEAKPAAFTSGWPVQVTYQALKPHYNEVGRMMEVQKVPAGQWSQRMHLMQDAAHRRGYANRFEQLGLAVRFDPAYQMSNVGQGVAGTLQSPNIHGAIQGHCVHLGNCDIGCEANARNTLDLNYLYVAQNKGAEIRDSHLVDFLEPVQGGFKVHFEKLAGGSRTPCTETATAVFVCAGSLGSTELLLRCRNVKKTLPNISARLGMGWSSNGDFLTPAIHPARQVNAERGPTIASVIDFHDGIKDGQRFWIQDGGVPNLMVAYLNRKLNDPSTGFIARAALEQLRAVLKSANPLEHVMPWFAQGVDASDGVLRLKKDSSGRHLVHLDWGIRKSEPVIDAIVKMHTELAVATAGIPLVSPAWTLFKQLITPHPLGGCNMADGPDKGVVDHRGQVFGYPGLHVLDGAVIPKAIGVNPSRTIAAVAEFAMKNLLESGSLCSVAN